MPMIRSFAVGLGDMFYIRHSSDNFTVIDCQLFGDHKKWLVEELKKESADKGITRFISTHPDEDHIQGIEYLDEQMPISNFYVVQNAATKSNPSVSFKHYCKLRDGGSAFNVSKGCRRKWMNLDDDTRGSSGISILWPDTGNADFKEALEIAAEGGNPNNISLVARYATADGPSFMWVGDLETNFMESIFEHISLPQTTVVFAPHHGRKSGKLPDKWLEKLRPKIIVIGEAAARDLHYYTGYSTLTQTSAGDITFLTDDSKIHCYVSNKEYAKRNWLIDEGRTDQKYYIGTQAI